MEAADAPKMHAAPTARTDEKLMVQVVLVQLLSGEACEKEVCLISMPGGDHSGFIVATPPLPWGKRTGLHNLLFATR